jgi:hypothetical protein
VDGVGREVSFTCFGEKETGAGIGENRQLGKLCKTMLDGLNRLFTRFVDHINNHRNNVVKLIIQIIKHLLEIIYSFQKLPSCL